MEVCRGHDEEELLIIGAGEGAEELSEYLMYSTSSCSFTRPIAFLSKYLNYCGCACQLIYFKLKFVLRKDLSVKEIPDFILFLKREKLSCLVQEDF